MGATHLSGPVVVTGTGTNTFAGPISGTQLMTGSASIEAITADTTLTADDNGKTFVMDTPGENITLPAVATTGWTAKFVVGAAFITTNWVVLVADGTIEGTIMVASTVVDADAETQANFVTGSENIGDWITLTSDGSLWHIDGRALNSGGITVTAP